MFNKQDFAIFHFCLNGTNIENYICTYELNIHIRCEHIHQNSKGKEYIL